MSISLSKCDTKKWNKWNQNISWKYINMMVPNRPAWQRSWLISYNLVGFFKPQLITNIAFWEGRLSVSVTFHITFYAGSLIQDSDMTCFAKHHLTLRESLAAHNSMRAICTQMCTNIRRQSCFRVFEYKLFDRTHVLAGGKFNFIATSSSLVLLCFMIS